MKNNNLLHSKKNGVFGHYGNKNLGDEAIIEAVIQNIRLRKPESRIACFSLNPVDSRDRYKVAAFPIRRLPTNYKTVINHSNPNESLVPSIISEQTNNDKNSKASIKNFIKSIPIISTFLKIIINCIDFFILFFQEVNFLRTSYHTLKTFDLLLITGSNQFLDNFGGSWGFPVTLLKWSILAKITKTKLIFISVGAGPLNSKLSKFLIRLTLLFKDYVSYRDIASKHLIENNKHTNGLVYPDLAFSLNFNYKPYSYRNGKLPKVGINVMPVYDKRYWCVRDDRLYQNYIEKMSIFIRELIQDGYPIFFFCTMPKDEGPARDILKKIKNEIPAKVTFDSLLKKNSTIFELMDNIAEADVIIATRFHGVVLSLLSRKPTLGICYYRKSRDLLTEAGQDKYAVDFDTFDIMELKRCFENLTRNLVAEQKVINQTVEKYKEALEEQYHRILDCM